MFIPGPTFGSCCGFCSNCWCPIKVKPNGRVSCACALGALPPILAAVASKKFILCCVRLGPSCICLGTIGGPRGPVDAFALFCVFGLPCACAGAIAAGLAAAVAAAKVAPPVIKCGDVNAGGCGTMACAAKLVAGPAGEIPVVETTGIPGGQLGSNALKACNGGGFNAPPRGPGEPGPRPKIPVCD